MPVERHARRPDVPLDRRDRRLLVALACVALAGVASAVVNASLGAAPVPAKRGCFTAIVPSTMGGATLHGCTAQEAAALCHGGSATTGSVHELCRELRRLGAAH